MLSPSGISLESSICLLFRYLPRLVSVGLRRLLVLLKGHCGVGVGHLRKTTVLGRDSHFTFLLRRGLGRSLEVLGRLLEHLLLMKDRMAELLEE